VFYRYNDLIFFLLSVLCREWR